MSVRPEAITVEGSDGTPLSAVLRDPGGAVPTVVFTNGLACPTFYWDALLERLSGRARLLTWDLKGHGDSGPARSDQGASVEASAEDLGRVLDAVGAKRAVLISFSVGCQVNLEFWRAHSERVAAYGLLLGTYQRPFERLIHPLLGAGIAGLLHRADLHFTRRMLQQVGAASKTRPGHALARLLAFVGPGADRATMAPFYDHLARIDPGTWLGLARSAAAHSAFDLLPGIDVPTLVVAGGRDRFTPPGVGQVMAETIPGAEWALFPGATHTGLLDCADAIAARVLVFLDGHRLLEPQARGSSRASARARASRSER